MAGRLLRLKIRRTRHEPIGHAQSSLHTRSPSTSTAGRGAYPMWEGIDAEMTRRRGTELGSEMAGMVAGIRRSGWKPRPMWQGWLPSSHRRTRTTSLGNRSSSTAGCGFRDSPR